MMHPPSQCIQPRHVVLGPKSGYSYIYPDLDASDLELIRTKTTVNLSLYFTAKHVLLEGLHVSAGIYNLLNQKMYIYPAVNTGLNVLPEQAREFNIKFTYELGN